MAGDVNVATLVATLEAKTKDFERGIRNAEKRLDGLEKNTKSASSGMDKFSKILKGAAALGAVKLGADLFKLGVQAEAWGKRYSTVFGEAAVSLDRWVDEQNERFGVAEERLKGMAAGVGDLLVPMGFARTQAAGMTKEVLTLANALSEWTGGARDTQETTDILTKALLGEREALKSLGVSLKDSEIKAELARQGMAGLTGEALKQAEAQIALELITKKSADALAAYESGSGQAMEAQKRFAAAIDQLQVAVGQLIVSLAPALEVVAKTIESLVWWVDKLDVAFRTVGNTGDQLKDMAAQAAFDELAASVTEADIALGRAKFDQFFIDFADGLGDLNNNSADAAESIKKLRSEMLKLTSPMFRAQKAAEKLDEVLKEIDADGSRTSDEMSELAQAQLEYNAAMEAFEGTSMADQVSAISEALGVSRIRARQLIDEWVKLGDVRANPQIRVGVEFAGAISGTWPRGLDLGQGRITGQTVIAGGFNILQGAFHDGGVVPGMPGAEVPILAKAGETVLPTHKSGFSGGVTVNVAGSVITDRDLEDVIMSALSRASGRGGEIGGLN